MIDSDSYTAVLLGTPNVPLSVKRDGAGKYGFDVSRWPHVTGTLSVSVTDPSLLEKLDPRKGGRIRLTANRTTPSGTQSRTFDLGIRGMSPKRTTSDVALTLKSDEAKLEDYGPLTVDKGARASQSSLRGVVNYVLGKIGAALEPGALDADVTAYWATTNVIYDSGCTNAANFTAAGNATTPARINAANPISAYGIFWTAQAAGQTFMLPSAQRNVRPGETWTWQALMRRNAGAGANGILRAYEVSRTGAVLRTIETPPVALSDTAAWTPMTLTFTITHPEAVTVDVYASAIAIAAGDGYAFAAPMLHQAGERVPEFNGATAAGGGYTYAWTDPTKPNATPSTRTPVKERPPALFTWPPGVGGMSFVLPLVQASGFRLVCDEQRKWTLRDAAWSVPGALAFRYGVNLIDVTEEASREGDDWFDGAVFRYTWPDANGIQQTRDDAYALPGATHIVLIELAAVYPGPGAAQYAVERARGKGRALVLTTVADLTAQPEQALSAVLPGTPVQVGIVERLEFDIATNRMTTTTRTTDTPADAWILIPAGERWIDSPVGASWIGEVI